MFCLILFFFTFDKTIKIKKMKKLLSVFVLFLAFTINANAQDKEFKKVDAAVEAQKDIKALTEFVALEGTMAEDLKRLFEYKFTVLNDNLSTERKAELANIIEIKLRATLPVDKMQKLEKNAELLKKLTH